MPRLWKIKLSLLAVYALAYQIFYTIPNLYPLYAPKMISLMGVDLVTPFVPWTFVIYISHYVLALSAILLINSEENFWSYVRMMFLTLLISGSFFWFFPTVYPRPDYPDVDNWLVSFTMNLVRSADTPNNCFPSMHVATAVVTTLIMRQVRPRFFWIYLSWTIAVLISTLTTKQHYFIDIIGGCGVAFFAQFVQGWVPALPRIVSQRFPR